MIEHYGAEAASRAGLRATELFAMQQHAAGDIWLSVKATIERLQAAPAGPPRGA
jgi:hypothetical protein